MNLINRHEDGCDLPDVHLLSVDLLIKVLQERNIEMSFKGFIDNDNKAIMLFTKVQCNMLTLHNSLDRRLYLNIFKRTIFWQCDKFIF